MGMFRAHRNEPTSTHGRGHIEQQAKDSELEQSRLSSLETAAGLGMGYAVGLVASCSCWFVE